MPSTNYYAAALAHLQQHPELICTSRTIEFRLYEADARRHIADNLLGFRTSLNLSQEKFARLLGISRSQYRKYETGEETIRLDIAQRITLKCGLPLFHLLQKSKYETLIKLPPKNPWFDRILFYANSISDSCFIQLCEILTICTDNKKPLASYQISHLTQADFASALAENEQSIYIAIAEGIRAIRVFFNLTQEDLAELMCVSTNTYQEYEKPVQKPRFNMLMAVRWTVATGIHPFVALAGTRFVKIRHMQAQRLEVMETLLSACSDRELCNLLPLIEGFYLSIKNRQDSLLFSLPDKKS